MKLFIITFAILIVLAGLGMLFLITTAAVIGRTIEHVSYYPRSENETEYGLRSLLFMYPNAIIYTPENKVSQKLSKENNRIIIHQEI